MRVGLSDLTSAWHLPGRALLFGLPLTFLGTAVLAHFLIGLDWAESLLIGAVLSPTDPVFATAIVGREEIPWRLRHLLNVESGLNDGLALPFVIVPLALSGNAEVHPSTLQQELGLGALIGVAVPWLAGTVEQSRLFAISKKYEPLFAFSIGLLIFALGSNTHANLYLAAFFAGITLATVRKDLRNEFAVFGEAIAELLKLAALMVFGALISPQFLIQTSWQEWCFMLLVLNLVRPTALFLAMLGTKLDWREKVAAYWFGTKGFASVIYSLLVLNSSLENAGRIYRVLSLVNVGSMIAHSSTDVVVARWFQHTGTTKQ